MAIYGQEVYEGEQVNLTVKCPFWGTFYRYYTSMMFCNVINTKIN